MLLIIIFIIGLLMLFASGSLFSAGFILTIDPAFKKQSIKGKICLAALPLVFLLGMTLLLCLTF